MIRAFPYLLTGLLTLSACGQTDDVCPENGDPSQGGWSDVSVNDERVQDIALFASEDLGSSEDVHPTCAATRVWFDRYYAVGMIADGDLWYVEVAIDPIEESYELLVMEKR